MFNRMFKRIALGLAVVLLSVVAIQSPALAWVPFWVPNWAAAKCMTAHGAGPYVNGTDIDVYTCISSPSYQNNQGFVFEALTSNPSLYRLRMLTTNKCLTVRGGYVDTNGTQMELWDCLDQYNQIFFFDYSTPHGSVHGYGALLIAASGPDPKCVTVHGAAPYANNTVVDVWDCLGQSNQEWSKAYTDEQ